MVSFFTFNNISSLVDPIDSVNDPASSNPVKVDEAAARAASEEVAVEVHPRKRKLRPREAEPATETSTASSSNAPTVAPAEVAAGAAAAPAAAATAAPLAQAAPVITNCYDMYLSIRKQIERRHRNLLPVQPKPPQGFKDYLMNRCTYVIAGNSASRLSVPVVSPPPCLLPPMRDLFTDQEKERYRLRMQVNNLRDCNHFNAV